MNHAFFGGPIDGEWHNTGDRYTYSFMEGAPVSYTSLVKHYRYGWFKTWLYNTLRRVNRRLAPAPHVWYDFEANAAVLHTYRKRWFSDPHRPRIAAFIHSSINEEALNSRPYGIENIFETVLAGPK